MDADRDDVLPRHDIAAIVDRPWWDATVPDGDAVEEAAEPGTDAASGDEAAGT